MFGHKDPRDMDRGGCKGVARHFFILKGDCREENDERLHGDRHGNEFHEGLCIRSCQLRGSVDCLEHSYYAVPCESIRRKGVGLGNLKVGLPLGPYDINVLLRVSLAYQADRCGAERVIQEEGQ